MGFFEGIKAKIARAKEIRQEIITQPADSVGGLLAKHEKVVNETLDRTGGKYKNVYIDPENPDRVIKYYALGSTTVGDSNEFTSPGVEGVKRSVETQSKINFYLQKLLHVLLPKNIPNRHLATTAPKLTFDERKRYNPATYYLPPDSTVDHVPEPFRTFIRELGSLGIGVDKASVNFGTDTDGNVVYLDDLHLRPGAMEMLQERINVLDDAAKNQALRFYKRLKHYSELEK